MSCVGNHVADGERGRQRKSSDLVSSEQDLLALLQCLDGQRRLNRSFA